MSADINTTTQKKAPHCIWYGQCNTNNYLEQNCPYDGPAKPLDYEGQKILAKWCPELMVDKGDGVKTCCDTAQAKALDSNIMLAANFLQRCPSCMHNFLKHVCALTCSPEQSNFLNVTDVKISANG